MKSSSGSVDPFKIQARLQVWLEEPPDKDDAHEPVALVAVELVHDHDKQRVQLWQVTRRTNVSQLAHEITDRAVDDANGLGDVQRYILQPYYGNSGVPNGRHPFFVQATNAAPDELDGTSLTEGPTAKGAFAQHMRFTEAAIRSGLQGGNQVHQILLRELDRQSGEGERLREELHRSWGRIRELEDRSFEKQILWRKTLFWEKIREELLKQTLPFLTMMGGAALQKYGLLGTGPNPPGASGAKPITNGTNGKTTPASMSNGQAPTKTLSSAFSSASASPQTNGAASDDAAPKPPEKTIESRLRRLWGALSDAQKQGFLMTTMSIGLSPMQMMPASELAVQLSGPETPRPHPGAKSLLEMNVQSVLGSFSKDQWDALCKALAERAGWNSNHIFIFNQIAKDLGRDENAFEQSIQAPRPKPPSPISSSKDVPKEAASVVGRQHGSMHTSAPRTIKRRK